ncbi:MAG: hypothetical protein PHG87_01530 [Candidatus Omnitrophica bacterium]|nr:hypothetical protein [Candidatus Omnitrophota bacterium]
MIKEAIMTERGWDALEIKLKARGLSGPEIQEARKSFQDGIETLCKMFLLNCSVDNKPVV